MPMLCETDQCGTVTSWGFPTEKGMRWCAKCAKGHPGSVDKRSKKCEDCHKKWPSFGLPGKEGVGPRGGAKGQWCAPCAKNHPGAIDTSKKMCEDCGETTKKHGACPVAL